MYRRIVLLPTCKYEFLREQRLLLARHSANLNVLHTWAVLKVRGETTTIKFEHMGSRVKFEWLPRINVSSTLVQHSLQKKELPYSFF